MSEPFTLNALSNIAGLSTAEAAKRLAEDGPNVLPKAEQRAEAFHLATELERIRRSNSIDGARKDTRFAALMQASPLFAKA